MSDPHYNSVGIVFFVVYGTNPIVQNG